MPPKYNNDTTCHNHSGYNIALYVHAGAYIFSLGFDRYVLYFLN
jgi:hypothetical protein